MTVLAVDQNTRGTEVAASGVLHGIKVLAMPDVHDPEYFTLIDDVPGTPAIFNIHPSTSHITVDTELMSNADIPYTSLKVLNIPNGSIFELTFD